MDAAVTQSRQDVVQPIGLVGVGQEIHVAGAAHDAVRREGQPSDQGWNRSEVRERIDCFAHLANEIGRCPGSHVSHIRRRETAEPTCD